MSELALKRARLRRERSAVSRLRLHDIQPTRANYMNIGAIIMPAGFHTPIVKIVPADGAAPGDVDRLIEALRDFMRR